MTNANIATSARESISETTHPCTEVGLQVNVATEQRFLQYAGDIYTETVGDYNFWCRYTDVFTRVKVVARTHPVEQLPVSASRANGPGVIFEPLPDYSGLLGALRRLPHLVANLRRVAYEDSAFIVRVPGAIGTLLYPWLRLRRWPFAVEVVGDPYDSLSPDALRARWAYLIRPIAIRVLRSQCRAAACAAYVTRKTLQHRYPPGGDFVTHYSSVELADQLFLRGRDFEARSKVPPRARTVAAKLIFVGSLAQRYKGLHVLLSALQKCRSTTDAGVTLKLDVLGDGACRAEYEQMARDLGLQDGISFHGYLSHEQVLNYLSEADLFVMPSLVEGLPRAMLEAMACGIPCIGSRIGGIPELLADEDMVPPGDPDALAHKIVEVLSNRQRLQSMSLRNRRTAAEYRSDILQARRTELYKQLKGITLKRRKQVKR